MTHNVFQFLMATGVSGANGPNVLRSVMAAVLVISHVINLHLPGAVNVREEMRVMLCVITEWIIAKVISNVC